MSNSPLVNYTKLSPNNSGKRTHSIDRITPHCVVGQLSVETMGHMFAQPSYQASCNYDIGSDGRVGLVVPEDQRSWCSSSNANDQRAVTIECASDQSYPYAINDTVYGKLLDLMTDICRRNGKEKLIWFGDKDTTLNYSPAANEMILTVHRWFAAKECPGEYIYSRLPKIAAEVTRRLSGHGSTLYRVRLRLDMPDTQIGAYWILDNAKANCPAGYSVYDENGKAVWTNVDATSSAAPGKYLKGIPATKEAYINAVGAIAQELYPETHILPSIPTAQACLEAGFGHGADSVELVKVNNLLGMKTDLINGSWKQYSVWKGESISKLTPEYRDGRLVYVTDSFRKYSDYENCIRDYEMFLLHVQNSKGYKYRRIQGMTDPAEIIHAIRIGTGTNEHPEGYCTDPAYEGKILKLIKDYDLTKFDAIAGINPPSAEPPAVSGTKYRVQIGAYKTKANANNAVQRVANKAGLSCFIEHEGDGLYHVYCGSYSVKENAEARVKELRKKGERPVIKEVN